MKKFSLSMLIMSLLMFTFQALAQVSSYVNEPVHTTYVNSHDVNLAYWLRIHPSDVYSTEIRNLSIQANSYVGYGSVEIITAGRLLGRLDFGRYTTTATIHFPIGTRISDIFIRINGEVFVERVMANIIERRWQPAPQPIPPRYPAPIPPRPIPPRYPAPAPRPAPPRHPAPAPRPAPPRHEPAPRPTPPRHEPAPRPTPPRHEPAPRPTPPRVEAPRPGQPRPGGPAPRPGQPRPGGPGPRR